MGRGAGWRVGSFRGVDIRLHISLLLILPYIVFITAARFQLLAQSAGVVPEDLALGPVAWGIVMAVLLFSSVLVHELGHVWVALRQGARVRSITLMMLGGVSDMEDIPQQGGQEFRLAIIGPVISLLLSGLGFGLYSISGWDDLSFVSLWFGQVNLVLAIFNLLPAFPLDGGRAFRSLMASRMGQLRATQVAVRVSTGFAWAFGIIGLLGFNVFLMLIAFFLYAAAQSELSMILARGLLKGLRVSDVLTTATAISEDATLIQATERMLQSRQTVIPVDTSTGPGLLSLQEVRSVPLKFRETVPAKELVRTSSRTLEINDALEEVLPEIASAPLGALPVVEAGVTVGFVRYSDLTDVLQLRSLEQGRAESKAA